MKKFFIKCMIMVIPWMFFIPLCIYTDVYNVFHPNTIRDTRASMNARFLKVKYLLENPKEKDALIFGSSRVGNIPIDYLNDNTDLHWYNMTYGSGLPEEHLGDLRILLEGGVSIRKIIIGIDDIELYRTMEGQGFKLGKKPYSEYVRLGKRFYLPYLYQFNFGVFKDVLKGKVKTGYFYRNGDSIESDETFLPRGNDIDPPSYHTGIFTVPFDTVLDQIRSIKALCDENGVEVIFITNPIWKRTYIDGCRNGYLDFLTSVAQITPFVNFSCLNEVTTNGQNYDKTGNHYFPTVGLLMLRFLLDEDFPERESLAASQFGVWVTCDNVDSVMASLRNQLESFSL